ncbi:hypothetical protein ACJMK2_042337 [Sinanodonta woodiana]|uniref:Uncharacterized protein n=1 Tax=Sinanodonta woodiana TaxID=1069815 RepID=A0ABD3W6Z0_SINWO
MSAGPLVVEIILTFVLAAFFLHRYGDLRKQHKLVTLFTFIAWYFSFMIIFILPLDVSSTFYRQCVQDRRHKRITDITTNATPTGNGTTTVVFTSSTTNHTETTLHARLFGENPDDSEGCEAPVSHVPDHVLPALWHVVYWTSQFLTWLLLPMMQSYSRAGDFSVAGKIKTALIQNAIYYGTYLLIFGVCLIYVAARPDLHIDAEKLKVIGVTASNTWGLFLLVLLLGYGLVEVPRYVWNNGNHAYTLSRTFFKIAKQSTEKTEAEENLEDVLEEIKKASENIRYNHPLRQHIDTILLKCPESMRKTVSRNVDDYEDYNKTYDIPAEKELVKLHRTVMFATQTHKRHQTQWNSLMEKALLLEDILMNEGSFDKKFKHTLSVDDSSGLFRTIYTPTVEWYWKCMLEPWVMRGLAVILIIISFMVVWSECLFFIKQPVLSIFAIFIDLAKVNYDYVYIELGSILTIAYLCCCAYYSVFQIKILNYYYIAPNHQTNEYSMIFTGMMLCRLTPPMCLNFLGLIHLDSHIVHTDNLQETSYTQIMGHMDVVSIISDGFNIYFPIAIVLLCICTYFSLGSRILHFLGFQQFIGDDDLTQELVDEGREIVHRERRRLERKADSDARRREWNERFGNSGSSRGTDVEEAKDLQIRKGMVDQHTSWNNRAYATDQVEQYEQIARQTSSRSHNKNDRSELLNQAEPIDYSGGSSTDLVDEYLKRSDTVGGYQSQAVIHSETSRPAGRPLPRGIFDDI